MTTQPRTKYGHYTSRKAQVGKYAKHFAAGALAGFVTIVPLLGAFGLLTPVYTFVSPVADHQLRQLQDYSIINVIHANERAEVAASSVLSMDEATSSAGIEEILISTDDFALPHYTQEQLNNIQIIREAAKRYGVSEILMLAIGKCESSFRSEAANPTSSARGLFQYIKATWMGWVAKRGLDWTLEDRFDAYKNADMTAYILQDLRGLSNWTADPKSHACWGYAVTK